MFTYFYQRLTIKDRSYMNSKLFSRSPILVALFGSTLLGNFLNSPAIAQQNNYYPSIEIAQRNSASRQPSMEQALSSLKDAEEFLKRASSDKGGHRMKALDFTKQAAKETEEGIKFDRSRSGDRRRSEDIQRRSETVSKTSEYQPNMQQAMSSLMAAQSYLLYATPDKGGHRMKALDLVKQAIKETQQGIEYDRTHKNENTNSQRTMRQALSSLQEVRKLLRSADPDKGGHRVKAIQLVEQAIQETQRGIEYDRTHGND